MIKTGLAWVYGKIKDNKFLLAVVAAGLALRLFHLGSQSLWLDESHTYGKAAASFAASWDLIKWDVNHPPLYFLLLHFWLPAGQSEAAMRFPSVVFGALTIPAVYFIGRRVFCEKAALLGALIVAISPYHIHYSQEARPYALAAFLGSLSVLLFLKILRSGGGPWTWAAYTLLLTGAIHTHYYGFFILISSFVFLSIFGRSYPGVMRKWLLSAAAALAIFAFWADIFARSLRGYAGYKEFPAPLAELMALPKLLFVFMAGHSAVSVSGPDLYPELLRFLPVTIPIFAVSVYLFFRGLPVPREKQRDRAFLLLVLTAPLAVCFLADHFGEIGRLLHPRYLLMFSPVFYLFVAAGFFALKDLPARLLAVLVVVVTMGYSLNNYYFKPGEGKKDWRGAASWMSLRASPGDALLLNFGAVHGDPFLYYKPGDIRKINLTQLVNVNAADKEEVRLVLQKAAGHAPGVWYCEDGAEVWDREGRIASWLDGAYSRKTRLSFNGLKLTRYKR